ncbi:hypothetical protein OpiT1DRAFT_00522 [Opitutaceae bacterium TAV1]|nr:hypothetical protein OpiT1DRAFT_00522 [Opitutaceae bacterium TAV1]
MQIRTTGLLAVLLAVIPLAFASPLQPLVTADGSPWPTKGGEGGQVITVTSLDETGPGTLREALDTKGPRIIRFAVAGEIWINDILRVQKPFVTIDGDSAPSPGITIIGDSFRITGPAHDVIVRGIRVRTGARSVGSDPSNRDSLQIMNGACNVLVENCSFAWAIDETVQLYGKTVHDIAVRRCIIAEALNGSLHAKGGHSAGLLVGPGIKNVLIEQNLFAHNAFRNPVVSGGAEAVVLDNLIYNPGFNAFHIYGHKGYGTTNVDVIGNRVIAGADTRPAVGIFHNKTGLIPGSRVYLKDNAATGTKTWDTTSRPPNYGEDDALPFVDKPCIQLPVTLSAMPVAEVEATVLANVGARVDDRDATDARILADVKNRTGKIRNVPDDKRLLPDPAIKNPQWTNRSSDAPPVTEYARPPAKKTPPASN